MTKKSKLAYKIIDEIIEKEFSRTNQGKDRDNFRRRCYKIILKELEKEESGRSLYKDHTWKGF